MKTDPDAGSSKAIGYGSGSGTHTAYNFSQLSIGSKDFDLCNRSAARKLLLYIVHNYKRKKIIETCWFTTK
jgi:hypothetical protein